MAQQDTAEDDMGRQMRSAGIALGALVFTASLAGCGAPPPPPPPTVVALTLAASPDANQTAAGQGAPVALRVYQLASTSAFTGAEFFQLYSQDQATLGPDLVKRDDITIPPGGSQSITVTPLDTVKAIGVFAAYRDYASVVWRVTMPVAPHKTTTVTITAGRAGLALPPPPPAGP
jgi:type VI secretion system protein VasD